MLKLDTILAPVDFSERSLAAAEHAVAVSKRFNSKLIFLHVIAPSPYQHIGELGVYTGPSEEQIGEALSKQLDELVQKVVADGDVEKLLVSGDPAHEIEALIQERKVGLVVMPTHGYGRFRRFVLGSITTKVLHDVACPVFTGAHVQEIEPADPRPYRHVGCAIDLDEYSSTILRWAEDFAQAYGAKLSVMHAVRYAKDVSLGELMRDAKKHIKQRLEKLHLEGEIFVEVGEVHRLIPALTEQEKMELLVIGRSHEEGLLGKLRTHAYALIRESPCPVVSV